MSDAQQSATAVPPTDEPPPAKGWTARLTRLAAASGSPRRTAAGVALGVFLSFSPFLGIQILLGFAIALALRLSRVAVLIGLCANLPWVIVPWYTLTTAAGAMLLRVHIPPEFSGQARLLLDMPIYRAPFWEHAADLAGPFLWSFLIGSTAGAVVMGVAAYMAVSAMLASARDSRLPS